MKYDSRIREEELKNRVAADFFSDYDCVNILGNIDFSVCINDNTPSLFDNEFLAWGEAKRGVINDFKTSFVQLILTVGKERTFDRYLPPRFLCEFDAKQIAFLPYDKILEVFYRNDFNWNVTPSNHDTREFTELYGMVGGILDSQSFIFNFNEDEKLLRTFIKNNFKVGITGVSRAKITKNNFISIYNRWLESVKPTIQVNWDTLKNSGVIDADFYLADIMSKDNMPIKDKLQVLLMNDHYMLARHIDESGLFASKQAKFNDDGIAHTRFWLKYVRPPKKEYQDFILNRRDLLVPQDIRERKGSYFTPRIWVDLAQQYLASVLGENWQDEYYIWDCCAGTGNLLAGLQNKYHVYASTLDKSDVDVMQERIKNGANLLSEHVFQFDFLNDGYGRDPHGNILSTLSRCDKLPSSLRDILSDEEKRRHLVIFINAPYSEIAGDKKGVNLNTAHDLYAERLAVANRELSNQFLMRIYYEIPGCIIGEFSKMKTLSGSATRIFRQNFTPVLRKCFVVPGNTFDNVKGEFPIGFKVWDTKESRVFSEIESDVYSSNGDFLGTKGFYSYTGERYISAWASEGKSTAGERIAWLDGATYNDFQKQRLLSLQNDKPVNNSQPRGVYITRANIIRYAVLFGVRHCIEADWLNDRDQFLYPSSNLWEQDNLFKTDCLVYMLFHGQNRITSTRGVNHWIPFTEDEVDSRERFSSHLVSDIMHGRENHSDGCDASTLFDGASRDEIVIDWSTEAQTVYDAGRALWRYYHSKEGSNPNASFYDIRVHFQGIKPDGKMNNVSVDEEYTKLIDNLRAAMKILAKNIEPKVYEYGFLKR